MGEAVRDGLAHPQPAGAVPVGSPGQLPGPVRGPVVRGRQQRLPVDREPVERVGHPHRGEVVGLGGQGQRVHHHVPRQVGPHPGAERPRPELRERVVPTVAQDDVVCRLRAPLKRITVWTGRVPHSQSTTVPLPASP